MTLSLQEIPSLFMAGKASLLTWLKYHPQITITFAFCLLSLIVPDNKLFFVLSGVYLLALFLLKSSVEEILIYSFFSLSIMPVGQLYVFQVIRPEVLRHPLYPLGRNLFFIFSPFYILLLTSIVNVVIQFFKTKRPPRFSAPLLFFFIAYLINFFSAANSNYFSNTSILYSIGNFGILSWLLIFNSWIHQLHQNAKIKLFFNIFLTLCLIVVFEGGIVALQIARRAPIGLVIEQTTSIPYFGAGADENALQFRPIGLHLNPNILANFFLQLILLLISLKLFLSEKKFSIKKNINRLYNCSLLILSLVIIFAQSRTIYLALFLFLGLNFLFNRALFQKSLKQIHLFFQKYFLLFLGFLSIFSFVFLDRVLSSINSFSSTGGIEVRLRLIQESLHLISGNLVWGVGPGMFIPALFAFNPNGVIKYFPEPVHNGFFLYITENGIISFLFLIMGLLVLIYQILKSRFERKNKVIFLSGIATILFPMILQGFNNFFDLYIFILIVIMSSEKNYVKKS